MEQTLWSENYARILCEIEEAIQEADDRNVQSYSPEEVMQMVRERIDRAREASRADDVMNKLDDYLHAATRDNTRRSYQPAVLHFES